MPSAPEFYVYVLFRPWDGSPFYVGKGKGRRWLRHDQDGEKNPNYRLANIIKRSKRLGLEIPKIKVRNGLAEATAFEVEVALIRALGRVLLVNLTNGGEGASNPAPETTASSIIAVPMRNIWRARESSDEAV